MRETEQYRAANDEIVDFIANTLDYVGDDMSHDGPELTTRRSRPTSRRFVERRRPRSMHLKVANNEERVIKLFAKRKKWRAPVSLGNGRLGWTQWALKSQADVFD